MHSSGFSEVLAPLTNGSIKSPRLREAFRGRERSRSVDRMATEARETEESEGCILM